jgi:hypothetical protein
MKITPVSALEFDDRCMTCLIVLGAAVPSILRTETDAFDQSLKTPCTAVAALQTYPLYAEPLCNVHLQASENAYKQYSFSYKILNMNECKRLWEKQKPGFWFKWDGVTRK